MTKQVFTAAQVLTAAQMNNLQNNDFNWDTSTKTTSYVLVAADAGTRVIMNSGSATTITVNTGLFAAGDVLWIHNIGAGTCTITAGTATVNTSGSLALTQWGGGSLYFTSASTAIFFPAGARNTLNVEFLLVGGGGGGHIGAGGAGGFRTGSAIIGKSTYNVTVGAGGSGAGASQTPGQNGTASSFIASANGGGGGGIRDWSGNVGGSGGGGGGGGGSNPGGAGVSGEGNNGGTGGIGAGNESGGGGGGAGGVGGNVSGGTGGAGGAASTNSYTGTSISYSGGGGGRGSSTGGTGGTNAGNGGTSGAGTSATANRGGGGGGGAGGVGGGNGGSGRVVVRYLTADSAGFTITRTGTTTTGTDGSYTWIAWDSTGTLVVA